MSEIPTQAPTKFELYEKKINYGNHKKAVSYL